MSDSPITTPPRRSSNAHTPPRTAARQGPKKLRRLGRSHLHQSPTGTASAEASIASAPFGPSLDLNKHEYGVVIPVNAAGLPSIVRCRGSKDAKNPYQLSLVEDCVSTMEGARRLTYFGDLSMEEASHVLSRLFQRDFPSKMLRQIVKTCVGLTHVSAINAVLSEMFDGDLTKALLYCWANSAKDFYAIAVFKTICNIKPSDFGVKTCHLRTFISKDCHRRRADLLQKIKEITVNLLNSDHDYINHLTAKDLSAQEIKAYLNIDGLKHSVRTDLETSLITLKTTKGNRGLKVSSPQGNQVIRDMTVAESTTMMNYGSSNPGRTIRYDHFNKTATVQDVQFGSGGPSDVGCSSASSSSASTSSFGSSSCGSSSSAATVPQDVHLRIRQFHATFPGIGGDLISVYLHCPAHFNALTSILDNMPPLLEIDDDDDITEKFGVSSDDDEQEQQSLAETQALYRKSNSQLHQNLDFTCDVAEQDKRQAEKSKEVGRAAMAQALDLGAKYRSKITAKNGTDITNEVQIAATNMPDLPSSAQDKGKGKSKGKGKAKDAPITVAPLTEWMGEVPRGHPAFCTKVPSESAKDAAEARVHLLRTKDQYQAGLIIADPYAEDEDNEPNIKLIHPCVVANWEKPGKFTNVALFCRVGDPTCAPYPYGLRYVSARLARAAKGAKPTPTTVEQDRQEARSDVLGTDSDDEEQDDTQENAPTRAAGPDSETSDDDDSDGGNLFGSDSSGSDSDSGDLNEIRDSDL